MVHSQSHDTWRNLFHIQPPTGLLNDPNGLIFHEGVYHIFYQWHPDAPIHGLKYWYHVTSTDLVHWTPDHRIMSPDTQWDAQGAYSGSACVINNTIELFYTGNTRDAQDIRHPFQVQATLTDAGIENKHPIIDTVPFGYTDHFRDPKVFKLGHDLAMIIGAQTTDLQGGALIYKSKDTVNWFLAYPLKTNFINTSYMWECPDLFHLDDRDVLMFCPQGMFNTPANQTNVYPNAYVLGAFHDDDESFHHTTQLQLFDYGFDFYAAQTFEDEDHNRVLIAWAGNAEGDYPTTQHNWVHVLSVPRILSIKDEIIHQLPHPKLRALRKQAQAIDTPTETYELIVRGIEGLLDIHLFQQGNEHLDLTYNAETKMLTLDRSHFKHQFAHDRGTTRSVHIPEGVHTLQILRDTSTIEIFINDGRYTMTARFFPENTQGCVAMNTLSNTATIEYYELEDANHDL